VLDAYNSEQSTLVFIQALLVRTLTTCPITAFNSRDSSWRLGKGAYGIIHKHAL